MQRTLSLHDVDRVVSLPEQPLPPFSGAGSVQLRSCDLVPPWHEEVHEVTSDHALQPPLIAVSQNLKVVRRVTYQVSQMGNHSQ